MLDQLVAFCGDKIRENDVLEVFGFTSEQTVVDLTGQILRAETPGAIDLLHQQSEAGKDMMRLMLDLIAYLRDLLVFKVKPDALKEDVEPGMQTSLTSHADLITTERLLELIDQFAVAEGRMKWAPNKKLHFEVAIIKAIQTLGQATLDEVIEKLGELRDGGGRRPPHASARSVAAGADRGGKDLRSEKTAVSYSSGAPHVAETPTDANELWRQTLAKIPAQKAFVRNSAVAAYVLGIEGRNFQLGFAPADKALMEILGTPANRKFLETLLHEITGTDLTVKLAIKEELPSKQASGAEGSRSENFKEDPLIQEAIGLFNAQIVQEN
jgi:DNA polymerase III gamma/tau subunit